MDLSRLAIFWLAAVVGLDSQFLLEDHVMLVGHQESCNPVSPVSFFCHDQFFSSNINQILHDIKKCLIPTYFLCRDVIFPKSGILLQKISSSPLTAEYHVEITKFKPQSRKYQFQYIDHPKHLAQVKQSFHVDFAISFLGRDVSRQVKVVGGSWRQVKVVECS